MKPTKKQLFKRQTTLQEIGEVGQQKLQNASVLVVGCGGLGSVVAVYLATSGIGKLHLVDFDTIDTTNLHRQVFYTLKDVGKPKAAILSEFIKKRAPFTKVRFTNKAISKKNVFKLMQNVDIVVDGTDSLATKYLLNDACVIQQKPLVYGSLYKFNGYVAAFNILQKNGRYSANLRDVFPEMANDIPNCKESGTLNAIVGNIATMQVNEVLKVITQVGKPLTNQLLIYNSLQNSQLKVKLQPKILKDTITEIFNTTSYFDVNCDIQDADLLISSSQLKQIITDKNTKVIAVLPNLKLPFKVHQTILMQQFKTKKVLVDFNKTYVMVCQKGVNSYIAATLLKKAYPSVKVFSLLGGITEFNLDVKA